MASELGVQTIQHTNGTDALTIDSSGRVTLSNPVAFMVQVGTSTSDANNTNEVIVPFDDVELDTTSSYSTSTYEYTAPVTGIYHMSFHVAPDNIEGASFVTALFRVNDNTYGTPTSIPVIEDPQGAAYVTLSYDIPMQLTAGDTVGVYFRANGDTTTFLRQGSTFSGHLIG